MAATRSGGLGWAVYVTPSLPVVTDDFAPGEHERPWPPIPSTLIYGSRDAIVVDSFITRAQASAQADWIAASGKRLTAIYATHGHGDHFFGARVLLDRFPEARLLAHPDAIPVMRRQIAPEFVASFWESRFPRQLPDPLPSADALPGNELALEGERLVVVPLGFTDVEGTSCLHVPSLGLVAAGDAVYNGVHPRLVEAIERAKIDDWLAALQTIESLHPTVVVAGHKDPARPDSPRAVAETGQYIREMRSLAGRTGSARELYAAMLDRYPGWLNRGALWSSVAAWRR